MKENLNWAVLGTGVIANEMAQALQKMGKRHVEAHAGDRYIHGTSFFSRMEALQS